MLQQGGGVSLTGCIPGRDAGYEQNLAHGHTPRYGCRMGGYKAPKRQLHREFLYLNHDTIINSLSAFEAGKVDEIIHKVSEATEGGASGSLGANVGAATLKAGGGKKRSSSVEEELTRSRTQFSAFDSWITHLDDEDGIGEITDWNHDVRELVEVGDTVRFKAHVSLSKIQQVFLMFLDFVAQASDPNSVFKQPTAKVAELKKQSRPIENMMRGTGGGRNIQVSLSPLGIREPQIIARLDEQYLVGGTQSVEGEFTVIAQVANRLGEGDSLPAIRMLRATPATTMETTTMTNALESFKQPAAALGVDVSDADIVYTYPTVIVHPIAIFR